jgi:hypothetical protein
MGSVSSGGGAGMSHSIGPVEVLLRFADDTVPAALPQLKAGRVKSITVTRQDVTQAPPGGLGEMGDLTPATRCDPGDAVTAPGTQSSLAPQFVHCLLAKLPNMVGAEAPIGGAKRWPHWLQPTCLSRQLQKSKLAKNSTTNAS